jgi:hypothetical protein
MELDSIENELKIKKCELKTLLSNASESKAAPGKCIINGKNLSVLEKLLGEQCENQTVEISFHNAVYYKKTTRKNTNFLTINGICKKCNSSKKYINRLQDDISLETVDENEQTVGNELEAEGGLVGETRQLFETLENLEEMPANQQQKLIEQLAKTQYRNYHFNMLTEPNLENQVNKFI